MGFSPNLGREMPDGAPTDNHSQSNNDNLLNVVDPNKDPNKDPNNLNPNNLNQYGGKKEKNVRGPDGKMYYGIVAPQYVTVNGVKTKNKHARAAVFREDYYRTKAGLTKGDLMKNSKGQIVSIKRSERMLKNSTWKKHLGKKRHKPFGIKTYKKKKTRRKRKFIGSHKR